MVDRRRLYGLRSGAEGSIEEFVDDHRGRRYRYRGLAKTHVQHVLVALAIDVERPSLQEPADGPYRPRPPTAFQQYLDKRGLPRRHTTVFATADLVEGPVQSRLHRTGACPSARAGGYRGSCSSSGPGSLEFLSEPS
ncbi:transposase [Streptomyces adustus]|uniref:transposase n=1 Tax=Streptomyces adustus TaxID=1609272 RepID=UPI00372356D9